MEVTVISGSGLKGDAAGSPDLYVKLRTSKQEVQTSVVSSKEPSWHQTFKMEAETKAENGWQVGKDKLIVEVWEKSRTDNDDLLGTGSIDLERLDWNRNTVKVVNTGKGHVQISLKAVEFGQGKKAPKPTEAPRKTAKPPPPAPTPFTPIPNQRLVLAEEFPHYWGPYLEDTEQFQSGYFSNNTFTRDDDVHARRVNNVVEKFPVYQGQQKATRTPTSRFRPMPDVIETWSLPPPSASSHPPPHGQYRPPMHGQAGGPPGGPSGGFSGGPPGYPPAPPPPSSYPPPPPPPNAPPKKHPDIGTLHVTVMKATVAGENRDTAVKVEIADEGNRGGEKSIVTGIKKDTKAPQWNESFKFFVRLAKDKPTGRLGRRSTMKVRVTLLDKTDGLGKELGSCEVKLDTLYCNKGTEFPNLPLYENDGKPERKETPHRIWLTLKPLAFGLEFRAGDLKCWLDKVEGLTLEKEGEVFAELKLREETHELGKIKVTPNQRVVSWEQARVDFKPDVWEKDGVVQCTTNLEIFIKQVVSDDEHTLGSVTVPLNELPEQEKYSRELPLQGGKGTVHLRLLAENFGKPQGPPKDPSTSATHQPATTLAQTQPAKATTTTPEPLPPPSTRKERPILVGFPMPPSATTPLPPPPSADSNSLAFKGMKPLDPDDAAIAALKEELYHLQQESFRIEQARGNDVVPLQQEIHLVRAQLDRATTISERLMGPGPEPPLHTFGTGMEPNGLPASPMKKEKHRPVVPLRIRQPMPTALKMDSLELAPTVVAPQYLPDSPVRPAAGLVQDTVQSTVHMPGSPSAASGLAGELPGPPGQEGETLVATPKQAGPKPVQWRSPEKIKRPRAPMVPEFVTIGDRHRPTRAAAPSRPSSSIHRSSSGVSQGPFPIVPYGAAGPYALTASPGRPGAMASMDGGVYPSVTSSAHRYGAMSPSGTHVRDPLSVQRGGDPMGLRRSPSAPYGPYPGSRSPMMV